VLPLIMAALAGVGVLLVFYSLAGSRPMDPVQARLSQLGSMQARTLEEIELQQPLFERTLRPMARRLSGVAQRFASPSKVSRTEKRLLMAGSPGDLRTVDFLGLKLVIAGLVGVGVFVFFGVLMGNPAFGFMGGLALGGLGFMFPEIWLSRRIKKRQKSILMAVPDTLDLLTISVKAGLSFDGGLAKVLQVQSEQLRIERRQRAEEMAAKAPIKMLFPLVGCIFPSMFIVILGPAIILIMLNMSTGK